MRTERATDMEGAQDNEREPIWVIVIDGFLDDPDAVRSWALHQRYVMPEQFYGVRSHTAGRFDTSGVQDKLESYLQRSIVLSGPIGVVWLCLADEAGRRPGPHTDSDVPGAYGCILYLTPGLPADCGTSFWRTKNSQPVKREQAPLNPSCYEETGRVDYKYNRMLIYPLHCLHSATRHYGATVEDGRMIAMWILRFASAFSHDR